jgi:tetratricopeptide (TPR) repeat protein
VTVPGPHQDPRRRPVPPDPGPAARDRLRDLDSADAANALRIAVWFAPACIVMLSMLWYFFYHRGYISGAVFGFLVLLTFPIAAVGVFVIHAATMGASSRLVRTIYSAGNLPPPRSYPHQEAMIARGQYREAADHFRDHLVVEPADNAARLRLAALLETQLGEPGEAEALYKQVRDRAATPHEEAAALNGLIDLYRRTGQRGRLMVELARFAGRFGGSAAARAAARELEDLKRGSGDDPTSGSPRSPR